ncbi:MAG: YcbK family protein [Labilithrix sp.]|nr:YcbK family protein [Labilithrix sp.]MCW5814878.1 YcbK family protein [Labilithrix sp.]
MRRHAWVLACAFVALLAPAARGGGPTPAKKPAPTKKPAPAKKPAPVPASRAWHTPPPGRTAPVDESGRPQLVLQALNTTDRVTLTAHSERGGFSAEDLDRAAHVLRDTRSGNEHPIDPHVLDLVYRIATHFQTAEVRVISAYRTPRGASRSNHGSGRAIDCVFPGTTDEEVAKLAREEGFTGVGTYPVSGFVHLDVRDRSYFWVDSSGPGKRNRTRGILGDLAAKSDQRALARGEHGVSPFGIGTDVDGALASAAHGNVTTTPQEEDDDEETAP